MSRPSKFSRSPQTPTSLKSNISEKDQDIDFEDLQRRLEELNERKLRRKIDLENARKQLQACERQAGEMGVDTYEELERKVLEMEKQEKQEMDEFIAELTKQESILDQIEIELRKIEEE